MFTLTESQLENKYSNSNINDEEHERETVASIETDDEVGAVLRGFLAICGGRNLRNAFMFLLIGTSICLGIIYAYWERGVSQSRRVASFEYDSTRMSDSLLRAFSQYLGAAAVEHNYMMAIGTDVPPTREGFNSFADVFVNSGLTFQVMGFVPRILASEREAVEINSSAYWTTYFAENGINYNYTGLLGLEPIPDKPGETILMKRSEQERYYPVHFMYPVIGNLEALDFDLYSADVRRKAIDAARFSGEPALTARLILVQETRDSVYSILLFWPGPGPEDDLVTVVLRIPDLMSSAFSNLKYGIEVYLYDTIANSQDGENPAYEFLGGHVYGVGTDSDKYMLPEKELSEVLASATTDALVKSQTIAFADRSWIIVTRATSDYKRTDVTSRVVGGTLLGLLGVLLAGWYNMDVRMHDRVAQHAAVHRIREATVAANAERRVNDFVAHEVRNPLTVALTANRFTLEKVTEATSWPDEDARQGVLHDASLVQASLTFIHELLDNIVDVTQFTRNKLSMNNASLSLRDHVLLRVQRMLGDESMAGNTVDTPAIPNILERQHPTRLVVDTGDDPLWTVADGTRLVQVVLNLVKNAMRLAPAGLITISAQRKDDPDNGVLIKVSDTGPGVPNHIKATLFDKSTLDLSHDSKGFGLNLCNCIVKSMDGLIYLDETYHSGVAGSPGACFVVDLPLPWVARPDGPLFSQSQEAKSAVAVSPASEVDIHSRNALSFSSKGEHSNSIISVSKSNSSSNSNINSNSYRSTSRILSSLQRRMRKHSSSNSNPTNNIQIQIDQASGYASSNSFVAVPRRCLIIDDDAVVRAMMKRQLKACFPNWNIETADSGEAALALVRPKAAGGLGLQFDVCMVDQYMPGPNNPMTGDQVIGAMRKINMAGYRIGCSANLVEALHVGAGADGFIRKPANNAALREVVGRVFSAPPLRSCLVIAKSRTVRSELKHRLRSAVAPNCVFREAESINDAVEMTQLMTQAASTSGSDDSPEAEGAVELIIVDEMSCVSGNVLASAVAKRLRRQVSADAKVVIVYGNVSSSNSPSSHNSRESDGSVRLNAPMGFNLAWPCPLPLADVMRADLMRVLLPSGDGNCDETPPPSYVDSDHCTVEMIAD